MSRRFSVEEASERFLKKIKTGSIDECWEWTGGRVKNHGKLSYGRVWIAGKHIGAHRFAWELKFGPIERGLDVLHKCDNPPCCNPNHLYLGTDVENARDRIERGRAANMKGEKHPMAILTQEDVVEIRRLDQMRRLSRQEIGKRYGISGTHVGRIVMGVAWDCVDGAIPERRKQRFTKGQIQKMFEMKQDGFTQTNIAKHFKTHQSCVSRIIRGETHA